MRSLIAAITLLINLREHLVLALNKVIKGVVHNVSTTVDLGARHAAVSWVARPLPSLETGTGLSVSVGDP